MQSGTSVVLLAITTLRTPRPILPSHRFPPPGPAPYLMDGGLLAISTRNASIGPLVRRRRTVQCWPWGGVRKVARVAKLPQRVRPMPVMRTPQNPYAGV